MLIAESSIGFYQVSINQYACAWLDGQLAPLTGAKMASVLHRLISGDVIYVGF